MGASPAKSFAMPGIFAKRPCGMSLRPILFLLLASATAGPAQDSEPTDKQLEKELQKSSDEHMREELGVNDITTPLIATILKEFGTFQPIPLDLIAKTPLDAVYDNRLQTALFFGSLVADGFMLTIAERPQDIQNIGRSLIKQSRALGVGDRLTSRSKSLFELSDKGDWQGMREELVRTQGDVEKSMLDLRDEEMAHMISLGGWLRGFQLAAHSTVQRYSPDKAKILGRPEIMDYYLDRLDTLHPRLKKTEFVTTLIAKLKELRLLATQAETGVLSEADIKKMADLADQAEAIAIGPVDTEGKILKKP
jgi:hypothetical protein